MLAALLAASVIIADEKKPTAPPPRQRAKAKTEAELLVGKWSITRKENPHLHQQFKGATYEFTKQGTVVCQLAAPARGDPHQRFGSYELEDKSLHVKWAMNPGGPNGSSTCIIESITETELTVIGIGGTKGRSILKRFQKRK